MVAMKIKTDSISGDSANLDLLRSLAVIFVVLSHIPALESITAPYFYDIHALGTLGVIIFFVHTSLVLMLSLERQTEILGERQRAFLFFIRRAFRIYPLSILVVLVVSVLASIYGGAYGDTLAYSTVFSNLLLIQNFTGDASIPGTLWSLPFEIQMYLVLPALYLFTSRAYKSAPRHVFLLWIGSVGSLIILWRFGLNYKPFKFIPCFLPGIIAFTLRDSNRKLAPCALFFYVGLVAILYPCAIAYWKISVELAWPVCLGLGIIIPWCSEIKVNWLRSAGKMIARYSYGIYLVHDPCIDYAFRYPRVVSPTLQWGIFVTGTIVLSYLAYHWIEKPGIDLGRQLAYRYKRSVVTNIAVD
jgi:peptidoglycan/LPS O-acetylase OafA/YrhL